jgi:hypothetical protein
MRCGEVQAKGRILTTIIFRKEEFQIHSEPFIHGAGCTSSVLRRWSDLSAAKFSVASLMLTFKTFVLVPLNAASILDAILSQLHPHPILTYFLLKVYFNVTVPGILYIFQTPKI